MYAIKSLYIYPFKSMAGIGVSKVFVDRRGLRDDRRFMVVDDEGRFVSQRTEPKMARIEPSRVDAGWSLCADGHGSVLVSESEEYEASEVCIWEDTCRALDMGDEAAAFLSDYLGRNVRLVYMPDATERAVDPNYRRGHELVSFADGFPFLLTTEASRQAVEVQAEMPVDERRFRPNLVVAGQGDAFAEDTWQMLRIGQLQFYPVKPCARCVMVDVAPDLGRPVPGVLKALAKLRKVGNQVFFGQNLLHEGSGQLAVGDIVHVE